MSKGILHSPIEYLIVGAGGGGSENQYDDGSGGGGGGVLHGTLPNIANGTYPIVIGTGVISVNGTNTTALGLTAYGGGRGAGHRSTNTYGGANGGGAGGAYADTDGGDGITNGGVATQGFDGGSNTYRAYAGAGGGGAAELGGSATEGVGGNGGKGVQSKISGKLTYYGAGGGGYGGTSGGIGGSGIGGTCTNPSTVNTPPVVNSGAGGAGGSSDRTSRATAGANGIVIIRYLGPQKATGGTITNADGYTIHTFTSSDDFVYNDEGASWEFWYKKNGVGYSDDIIFCKEDVCEMRDVSNNLSIALYSSTSAWAWIDTTFNVVPGTTYHVVATFDGANIKVYVNSDLKLTSAKTGTLSYNDNPYKLNARGAVEETISAPGNHTFYIFRIYSRALKSAEIRNNYNNDKNLFGL